MRDILSFVVSEQGRRRPVCAFTFTVCIFDSFVCDLGILDPCKILWFCSIVCDLGILGPRKIVWFCKDGICLWTSDTGCRKIDCNLYKSIPRQSFFTSVYVTGILDPCKILWFCKDGICLWMTWHGDREIYCNLYKSIPCQGQYMGYREMCCSLCKSISHQSFWPLYQNTSHNNQNMMTSDKHFEGYSLYIWQLCQWFRHFRTSQNSVILQHCDLGIGRLQSVKKHVQSIFFLFLKIA